MSFIFGHGAKKSGSSDDVSSHSKHTEKDASKLRGRKINGGKKDGRRFTLMKQQSAEAGLNALRKNSDSESGDLRARLKKQSSHDGNLAPGALEKKQGSLQNLFVFSHKNRKDAERSSTGHEEKTLDSRNEEEKGLLNSLRQEEEGVSTEGLPRKTRPASPTKLSVSNKSSTGKTPRKKEKEAKNKKKGKHKSKESSAKAAGETGRKGILKAPAQSFKVHDSQERGGKKEKEDFRERELPSEEKLVALHQIGEEASQRARTKKVEISKEENGLPEEPFAYSENTFLIPKKDKEQTGIRRIRLPKEAIVDNLSFGAREEYQKFSIHTVGSNSAGNVATRKKRDKEKEKEHRTDERLKKGDLNIPKLDLEELKKNRGEDPLQRVFDLSPPPESSILSPDPKKKKKVSSLKRAQTRWKLFKSKESSPPTVIRETVIPVFSEKLQKKKHEVQIKSGVQILENIKYGIFIQELRAYSMSDPYLPAIQIAKYESPRLTELLENLRSAEGIILRGTLRRMKLFERVVREYLEFKQEGVKSKKKTDKKKKGGKEDPLKIFGNSLLDKMGIFQRKDIDLRSFLTAFDALEEGEEKALILEVIGEEWLKALHIFSHENFTHVVKDILRKYGQMALNLRSLCYSEGAAWSPSDDTKPIEETACKDIIRCVSCDGGHDRVILINRDGRKHIISRDQVEAEDSEAEYSLLPRYPDLHAEELWKERLLYFIDQICAWGIHRPLSKESKQFIVEQIIIRSEEKSGINYLTDFEIPVPNDELSQPTIMRILNNWGFGPVGKFFLRYKQKNPGIFSPWNNYDGEFKGRFSGHFITGEERRSDLIIGAKEHNGFYIIQTATLDMHWRIEGAVRPYEGPKFASFLIEFRSDYEKGAWSFSDPMVKSLTIHHEEVLGLKPRPFSEKPQEDWPKISWSQLEHILSSCIIVMNYIPNDKLPSDLSEVLSPRNKADYHPEEILAALGTPSWDWAELEHASSSDAAPWTRSYDGTAQRDISAAYPLEPDLILRENSAEESVGTENEEGKDAQAVTTVYLDH